MRYVFQIVFLLFAVNNISAQFLSKDLKGKVVSEAPDLANIYVINLKTEATASTIEGGYFRIPVTVGDTLLFSGVQIKGQKIAVTEKEFHKDLMLVQLEAVINRLEEVIVKQYKNINAVSLGIISPNTKRYTPAERKLNAASGVDAKGNTDGTMGGSAGLDPLLNWMSGRTAMLKKEVEVEKKETLLDKLEQQFGMEYCIDKLKIPKEYVKGFWYYVLDEVRLVSALNSKNTVMAHFVLAELATKYLELQKGDK